MTFEEFGFEERIQKAIDEAGFKSPMPVQAQCFQLLIKEHRDIYAQSQTGTGKTAAFLLGIFQLMLTEEKYKDQKALVVVPTRELAVQIETEGKMLSKYLDFKMGSVYGGVGYHSQEKMLKEGVDVLVGTPGRLLDFSKQRKFSFKDFRFLVIDEADRLFDMGFLPDLRKIMKGMRPYNERHTMLFSATLNPRVGNLAWEYMNDPGEVIIEPEKVTVDTVTQELYHVGKDEKLKLLLGILKRDNPDNAVIFTNTRHSAWEVAKRLEVNGYEVAFLMGDLPQSKRLRIVDEVKQGKHRFLVATDVAARGLHINDLQMVINYDVPLEAESYVHRIGRTARAGQDGKTVTMACEEFVYGLGPIEKLLGKKIPVSWADESFMVEDKSEGMRFPPQDRYRELGGRDGGRGGDRGHGKQGGTNTEGVHEVGYSLQGLRERRVRHATWHETVYPAVAIERVQVHCHGGRGHCLRSGHAHPLTRMAQNSTAMCLSTPGTLLKRLSEGRRFSEGLHQALEAKERVEIKEETQTLADITFQNYFRMYDKLAGMTGTAQTSGGASTSDPSAPRPRRGMRPYTRASSKQWTGCTTAACGSATSTPPSRGS